MGETYIEPFAGGAGLALKLLLNNDVRKIVINDFDFAIYSFWYCILTDSDKICNFIKTVPLTFEEWEKQHFIYMNQNNYSQLELAQAVLFLNRTNISGILTGGIIGGRKQTGKYKIDARFNRSNLIKKIKKIASLSNRIDLYNYDAINFLKEKLSHYYKAFINFDPPYVIKGQQLYKNAFTKIDHEALRDQILKCQRKWVVTYDMCDIVLDLYKQFRKSTINIRYSANKIKTTKELIFFSNTITLPSNIDVDLPSPLTQTSPYTTVQL